MKKFLALIFGVLFVAVAMSCGGDDSSESDSLTAVSITVSAESVKEGKTLTLTANPTKTGKPAILYAWQVSPTESASLSATTGEKVTLTANAQGTVTVSLSASYESTSVSAQKQITITPWSADISVTPGAKVTTGTGGWADSANGGTGMTYPNTENIIYIGDAGYKVGTGKMTKYSPSITKRAAFTNAIASGSVFDSDLTDTPAIIVVAGTVDLSDGKVSDTDHSYFNEFNPSDHTRLHKDIVYEVGANKAIIGVDAAKLAFGGLTINGHQNANLAKNVIIRNIEFWDSHGSTEYDTNVTGTFTYSDGKEYPYSHKNNKASSNNLGIGYGDSANGKADPPENIWIDHCKFSDGTCNDMQRNYNHDGALDIPFGKNITVSYCEFTNHDKVGLVGSNDSLTDAEVRLVTFHHNYYHSVTQRNPLLRASKSHVYNNYYNDIGIPENSGYAVGICQAVQLILENNYFGTFQKQIFSVWKESEASLSAKVYASGNNKAPSDIDTKSNGGATGITSYLVTEKPWTPAYTYTPDAANELPQKIPLAAGIDKDDYSALVEVNGVRMNGITEEAEEENATDTTVTFFKTPTSLAADLTHDGLVTVNNAEFKWGSDLAKIDGEELTVTNPTSGSATANSETVISGAKFVSQKGTVDNESYIAEGKTIASLSFTVTAQKAVTIGGLTGKTYFGKNPNTNASVFIDDASAPADSVEADSTTKVADFSTTALALNKTLSAGDSAVIKIAIVAKSGIMTNTPTDFQYLVIFAPLTLTVEAQ